MGRKVKTPPNLAPLFGLAESLVEHFQYHYGRSDNVEGMEEIGDDECDLPDECWRCLALSALSKARGKS